MNALTPSPSLAWPIDYQTGVVPIAEDELCRLVSYKCIAGKWTCGWGETEGVTPTTCWTQDYADQRFCDSLAERTQAVKTACIIEPTSNQLSALVSFAYNYGGWRTSTALKAHNRGDTMACANALQLVDQYRNPQTGRLEVSEALRRRRAREAALYLKPMEGAQSMPQEVAKETKLVASPTIQASTVATAGGALALVGQAGDTIAPIKASVDTAKSFAADTLGIPTGYVLPGMAVVIGGVVLWRRFGQRMQGAA